MSATPIDNGLFEIKQQLDCFIPNHRFKNVENVNDEIKKNISSFMIRGLMNIELKNEFKPFVANHMLFTLSTVFIFFVVILLSRFQDKTWGKVLHHCLLVAGLFTVLSAGFYGGELVHRFNLPTGIEN